jgi:hypothetical protein
VLRLHGHLGLSLPQHDVSELYVRVGPTHPLVPSTAGSTIGLRTSGARVERKSSGGCTEYVTEVRVISGPWCSVRSTPWTATF